MRQAPKVIVLAGANGAGKSTLAPALLRDTFGLLEYVNADTIALGLSAFQPERAAIEAGRVMLRRLHALAAQRVSFAFESTLAGRTYAAWLGELSRAGYEINLLFLWLRTPELAMGRVRERVRAGGHDIPEEVVRRRYLKGIRNFFELYQPLAETWGVYDNSAAQQPLLLATSGRGTSPMIYEPEAWSKFCEVAK